MPAPSDVLDLRDVASTDAPRHGAAKGRRQVKTEIKIAATTNRKIKNASSSQWRGVIIARHLCANFQTKNAKHKRRSAGQMYVNIVHR